jgi:hypothetical protein
VQNYNFVDNFHKFIPTFFTTFYIMEGIEFWDAYLILEATEKYKSWNYYNGERCVELVNFALQGNWEFKKHGWEEVYFN